jgi:hypothetical protein
MTYPNWREPVAILKARCGPATAEQISLATATGLDLSPELPATVAASLLDAYLRPTIWATSRPAPRTASAKQRTYLASLAPGLDASTMSLTEASAWIDHFLSLRTVAALEELRLRSDDRVVVSREFTNAATGELTSSTSSPMRVSSIGGSGLVYFRGGNGQCAWPSSLALASAQTV